MGEPLDYEQAEQYTYGEDEEGPEILPHSVEDTQDILHSEMTGNRRAHRFKFLDPSRESKRAANVDEGVYNVPGSSRYAVCTTV